MTTPSQRIALLVPDGEAESREYAAILRQDLAEKVDLLDADLASAAYRSISPQTPFNLTASDAKLIGMTVGCDLFILVRSATQRRSAFRRNEYYEAYAHIYLVSSRTGRLVLWKNQKFEAGQATKAKNMLADSAGVLAAELTRAIKATQKIELNEPAPTVIEEVPSEDSPPAKDFKAPIPYSRIKPEYTTEAALYGVAATVEILVDTDPSGSIMRTEIIRWAGYGLDESVERAVRAMNWRPAMRGGKALAMRFMLRYNFKRIEKEDPK